MLTVLSKNITPPGNWRYTVPQTGHTISSYDYTSFIRAYEDHCLANNIHLDVDYENHLLHEMCEKNQPDWKDFCKQVNVRQQRKVLGFAAAMGFLNVLKTWISMGRKLEEPEVAEARAKICATCPLNTRKSGWGCGSCTSAFQKAISFVVGQKQTSYSSSCGFCGVCGCAINAAVWFPKEAQMEGLTEGMKQQFRDPQLKSYCWKAQFLD